MKAQQNKTWTKEPFYMAPPFKKQIENSVNKILVGKQDRVVTIDGREGSGKSTFGLQVCYNASRLLNVDFTLADIVFNGIAMRDRIRYYAKNNLKHRVLLLDEAYNGLSSKGAISKLNKETTRLLMECRQLGLFIIIILPSFFMLEKYVAIFRSHALIHVFTSKTNINRRYFKVYNYKNKKNLYLLGHKYLNYSRPKITTSYRFYSKFPPTINEEEYLAKKLKAFQEDTENENVLEKTKTMNQRDYLLYYLNKEYGIKYTELSELLSKAGYPRAPSNIGETIRNMPKNPEKDIKIKT